ncbi:MAG: AAA family ATPase [Roseofilum sp. SBFL]|uniref:stress-responsive protein Ycf46 n=1 Tax=unclassified Roseofilum TaxID=2620099 RepID=UPI001B1CE7D8|nr:MULTISPECIES: AAA family ATPase [unclassified Roseofilum]MBP0015148.1 AAA family ATPase [Roseofilum sp. SID3]MBP0023958.1 AAA family ATPase [Roseofilum sp. SID2]MBP0039190.1 AAA family ATPase [Roseofilum sp. SID1]MBP0043296.1 AAA family ATPase [Roseofilum sp. SBFL]
MREQLSILIKAQYPLIYLVTSEEERAEQSIANLAQGKSPRRLYVWTVTRGMVEYGEPRSVTQHNTLSPEAAIEWVIRQPSKEGAIFIFKDLHSFYTPTIVRWLRDAIANFKGTQKTIILMSPVQEIPIELEKEIIVLDFPLPDLEALNQILSAQLGSSRIKTNVREKLLKAALGLTLDEAEKVYRKAQVTAGRLTQSEVEIVLSEKKQLIRRNGILEYIEEDETLDSVGGLEELKSWLKQRSNAFTERARQYGLPQPKGMLILGVPGCGKSLIAKTTSRLWGLPLLRLDMGRVYDGSMVGRSEANLRNALKTAESISPAILFIDELDKAFAGGTGSADSDGGTSSRIFGSFLTWMQEKTSPVFVMATANRVERLPGEFLRKGRFDEIFFVDLPNQQERQDIFTIHLEKRRRDISRFDIEQLSKICDGFSGAEIEQALIAAMYEAFAQDREFTQLDIIAAIKATLPLSKTMQEQVTALRDWARQRARPAAASVAEYQRLEF